MSVRRAWGKQCWRRTSPTRPSSPGTPPSSPPPPTCCSNLNGQETGRALERRLRHYTRPTLLVIDELGYLAYDARAADLIFQLVSRRYEHRSLLITTNLPFKRWDTVFPNASCAVALIDRLTHHVEILLIEGRSYRDGRPSSASRSATASVRTVITRRNDGDPHVVNETGRPLSRKRHFLKLDNINGRIRSSGQLGRWWYSISPCRNNECVRRFTVFAFNQRS